MNDVLVIIISETTRQFLVVHLWFVFPHSPSPGHLIRVGEFDEACVDAIRACRGRGGRVIAVGTTSVRSLETAAASAELSVGCPAPFEGDSDIFLHPGCQFRVVDAMITNFHLPESTLIMLVSAFAGYEETMAAYATAVQKEYRFFSYGDAMFVTRKGDS